MAGSRVHVDTIPTFKRGDPAPSGYVEWHEWARVQYAKRLRQRQCPTCGLWRFPQEKCCASAARKEARDAQ